MGRPDISPTLTHRPACPTATHELIYEPLRRCNSCNVRRIKCSGEKPCRQCRSSSRDCHYPAPVEKISVTRGELDDLKRRCEAAERVLQIKVPDAAERQQLLQQEGGDPVGSRAGSSSSFTPPQQQSQQQSTRGPSDAPNEDEADTAAAGRMLLDPDGNSRFLGETSGATFLDYLKEFMSTVSPLAFNRPWLSPTPNNGSAFLASLGKYQTYDSRPIYEDANVSPLALPSRAEMLASLNDLRYFIQDGNGTFPCGGIYWWGDLSTVPVVPESISFPPGTSPQNIWDKYRHLAFYHTAFAVACQANTTAAHMPNPPDLSQTFFARARVLLGNPLDITRWTISDVAVLALMGFYLIEMNRRDAAYMCVSNAMHISMMHGAHRGWVDERGKRVFWTLYILDRWLSCLMGRPPTISDDAVRLPLPNDAPSLPPAAGLRAHVELARISGHIVCNTYRVAPYDYHPGGAARHVERALQMLQDWLASLPPALQMPADLTSTDPACCLLHMGYNQHLILLLRPIFFIAVKKAFAERYITTERRWNIEHHTSRIRSCSEAARRNIHLARWLIDLTNGTRKLLQAGLHYVFNAAIILMLEELLPPQQQQPPPSPSPGLEDVNFAIGVFEEEAKTGSNYAIDCATVLKDLNSLIQRLRLAPPQAIRIPGAPSTPGLAEDMTLSNSSSSSTPTNVPPRDHRLHIHHQTHQQQTFPPGPGLRQVTEGDALYRQLATWVDNNDLQLYSNNNYLI
ncbi:fungal specific transcription factor domain-containing protein [Colletotrichum karsti]|uniref:Fungal specific transcription factor domain-containing protein n=1 Tax=Colletotrichum karsti TaxID=1095194 RepID=A0A9P6ICY6_9PEZI|nr:fungal specific transcription factor domain-containing protein [Colletotrichum karsti]KAF9880548.1 fungal specific transcription factor domain-containing protein [Colletotrichum karsti]